MTPRFAIVTPAYQAEATLPRAIESVLEQTFADWEYVIVDDGSTDATGALAAQVAATDPRVRVIAQDNAGCGAARARGIEATTAPWIVRLDADDALLPPYLERMAAAIDRVPGYDIRACNGWHLFPDGTYAPARPGADYAQEREFTFADMLQRNHVFSPATFSRRIFDAVGIRSHVYCEDLDLWLRALAMADARIRFIPEFLAEYRVGSSQMTADAPAVFASREMIYRDLLTSTDLSEAQRELVKGALERLDSDRWIHARRSSVVGAIERRFGAGVARGVSRLIHRIGQVLRPLAVSLLKRFGGGR